jgi:trimethylamine--corrinoid protein Co-methyltransferase
MNRFYAAANEGSNMSKGRLEFLTGTEIRRVHETSTRVLEEVGLVVHSEVVTKMLVDSGAMLSKDGKRVRVPQELVKSALAHAPKSILLAARDGKGDIRIPDHNRLHVSNGGEGIYIKDMLTGATRPSTSEDLRDFLAIIDSLPQVDFAWGMVGALDQSPNLKNMVEFKIGLENTRKHYQGGASDMEEARDMIALASILTDGPEDLRRRPIFSAVECPISPLTFEEGLAEAQVEFAKAGIPVVAMVASVAGLTSPVTLSGTIAQLNAENLASLVISQAAEKGAPWIYSSDSVPGNLVTGSIDYGALEAQLLRAGAGQMGRYYGLPTMVAGIGLESGSLSLSTVQEGVPSLSMMGLVPSDLGSGFGGVDQAAGASYEQLVVDAWVWDVAREFAREFSADDLAISFETIRDAGIDGNFLGKRHTLARFKTEFISTTKPEAVFSGRGDSGHRGDLLRKAKDEVQRILKNVRGPVVSNDESRKMDELIRGISRNH